MATAVEAPAKTKSKTAKDTKSKKPAAASAVKKPRVHPTYHEMIKEAIMALKERTGSSQFAIAKFIEEKQKSNLPPNFKKLLLIQLKKFVANGKLVKVKNSFKLPSKSSLPAAPAASKKAVPTKAPEKPKAEAKPKSTGVKRKATNEAEAKPKSTGVKRKAKNEAEPKPKKSVKTAATKSPAKKAVTPKKAAPVKAAKKPKSIKSPVKKATPKKAKK